MDAPSCITALQENEKLEPIKIKQDSKIFFLNINIIEDSISFSITNKEKAIPINYINKMNLKEIQNLNKIFYVLNSCKEFYDYL